MTQQNSESTNRPAALVTGAGIRLGKAIALSLANKGYDVAIHYNQSKDQAFDVQKDIINLGVHAELFQADLSQIDQYSDLIENVKNTFSNLQLLVNSASIFVSAHLKETEIDFFEQHMAINFKAPFFLTRDFAKLVQHGQVINIVDQRIQSHEPNYFIYTLTKKMLAEMTKMAAIDLAPNIRVNGIAPGYILPPPDPSKHDSQRIIDRIPLSKQGSKEQITQSVHYLLDNDFVTGQILYVDGGENL